jgi:tryptophan-rich sensory protein
MYKKFPGADKVITPADAPAPVLNAVRLMYAGAAVTLVYLVVSLASLGSIKSELHSSDPKLTTTQINQVFEYLIVTTVVFGVIGIALWLMMARGARNGRRWSQIVSTVLFALYTLESVATFTEDRAILSIVFVGHTWVIGAVTVFMLWKPATKAYFNPVV